MKKLIALFVAVLFLLGAVPAFAEGAETAGEETLLTEEDVFTGAVIDVTESTFSVCNEFGTILTFVPDTGVEVPAVGSVVSVAFTGSILEQPIASEVTVVSKPKQSKVSSAIVTGISSDGFYASVKKGTPEFYRYTGTTVIGGKADEVAVGQQLTITYVDTVYGKVALNVKITKDVVVKEEKEEQDLTNRTYSGTVTKLTDSQITIKTKKGKTKTFKISAKTQYSGKYELKKGATVTITFDGHSSANTLAKKIKITKPASKYKTVTGICEYFEGMAIGLTNGFEAGVAKAKHSGSGAREPGTKVKVTYYVTDYGRNQATKIKWY